MEQGTDLPAGDSGTVPSIQVALAALFFFGFALKRHSCSIQTMISISMSCITNAVSYSKVAKSLPFTHKLQGILGPKKVLSRWQNPFLDYFEHSFLSANEISRFSCNRTLLGLFVSNEISVVTQAP